MLRFSIPIRCDAPDDGLRLVAWLKAVIYEMATRRMLFGRFDDRIRLEPIIVVKG